jgi:hypothetical protein
VSSGAWIVWSEQDSLIYAAKGNATSDFYSFDPCADSYGVWTPLLPIPRGELGRLPKQGACAVSDNAGHIYVVRGNGTRDFLRYDIAHPMWSGLPPVPLMASGRKVGGGSAMAYVVEQGTGYVYLLKGRTSEFLRYNTVTGIWDTTLPQAPGGARPRWTSGSWLVAFGDTVVFAHKAKDHELFAFSVRTHAWTPRRPGMPFTGFTRAYRKSKDGGCAAPIRGRIVALKGGNTQEFWCFNPETDSWRERDTIPSFGSTGRKKRVGPGGAIAAYWDAALFALKGNRTCELWRYIETPDPPDRGRRVLFSGMRAVGQQSAGKIRDLADGRHVMVVRDATGRLVSRSRDLPAGLRPGVYFIRAHPGGPARKLVILR